MTDGWMGWKVDGWMNGWVEIYFRQHKTRVKGIKASCKLYSNTALQCVQKGRNVIIVLYMMDMDHLNYSNPAPNSSTWHLIYSGLLKKKKFRITKLNTYYFICIIFFLQF